MQIRIRSIDDDSNCLQEVKPFYDQYRDGHKDEVPHSLNNKARKYLYLVVSIPVILILPSQINSIAHVPHFRLQISIV